MPVLLLVLAFFLCSPQSQGQTTQNHPNPFDYRFEVTAEKKRIDRTSQQTISRNVVDADWAFEISIRNISFRDVEELQVRYTLYIDRERGSSRATRRFETVEGEAEVAGIQNHATAEVLTTTVSLHTHNLRPGWIRMDGSRRRVTDDLAGVKVEIFHQDELISEVITPSSIRTRVLEQEAD